MTTSLMKNIHISLILLLAVTLASCGFQLKQSAAIPASFGPVSIAGINQYSDLYKTIKTALKQSDIQISESGNHHISISNVTKDRRVLSVDTFGKVAEYELFKSFSFSVSDNAGNKVIESQTLATQVSYTVSSTDILAKNQEEDDLNRRMEEKLVDQMLRYISNKIK